MDINTLPRRALLSSGATLAAGTLPAGAATTGNATAGNETNASTASSNETTEQTGSVDNAMDAVRLAHFAPDVGPIDVYANGTRGFDDVSLFQQTKYIENAPKGFTTVVTPTGEGQDASLLETEVSYTSGAHTLVFVGEHCATTHRPLDLVALKDDYSEVPEGQARVRLVHASPDAPTLDIRTDDGELLIEGLEFGAGEYIEIPADGSQQALALHETGSETHLVRVPIEPEAGNVYTGFFVGYLDIDSAPEDAPEEATFGFGVSEDTPPTRGN